MSATLLGMAKKKHPDAAASSPSAPVRIRADLARKINLVAKIAGTDVSAMLTPLVAQFIEREYAKAVRGLTEELDEGE